MTTDSSLFRRNETNARSWSRRLQSHTNLVITSNLLREAGESGGRVPTIASALTTQYTRHIA